MRPAILQEHADPARLSSSHWTAVTHDDAPRQTCTSGLTASEAWYALEERVGPITPGDDLTRDALATRAERPRVDDSGKFPYF